MSTNNLPPKSNAASKDNNSVSTENIISIDTNNKPPNETDDDIDSILEDILNNKYDSEAETHNHTTHNLNYSIDEIVEKILTEDGTDLDKTLARYSSLEAPSDDKLYDLDNKEEDTNQKIDDNNYNNSLKNNSKEQKKEESLSGSIKNIQKTKPKQVKADYKEINESLISFPKTILIVILFTLCALAITSLIYNTKDRTTKNNNIKTYTEDKVIRKTSNWKINTDNTLTKKDTSINPTPSGIKLSKKTVKIEEEHKTTQKTKNRELSKKEKESTAKTKPMANLTIKPMIKLQAKPITKQKIEYKETQQTTKNTTTKISKNKKQYKWILNLSSVFSNKEDSHKELKRIIDSGIKAQIKPITVNNKVWYRIRVWGFSSKQEAQDHSEIVKEKTGIKKFWISRSRNKE